MRLRIHAVAWTLLSIAACSASGNGGEPDRKADDSQNDASVVEPLPADDAGGPIEPDADRSLICGKTGFCETRLPVSDDGVPLSLRRVWAVAQNDVWSVTAEGYVLHYDGEAWKVDYRARHPLHSLWVSATSVWIGGDMGLLFRRSKDGEWSRIEPWHLRSIRAIYGSDDDDVWFATDTNSLDHFDGSAITNHSVNIPGLRITSVFGRPGSPIYAAGHVAFDLADPTELGTHPDRSYAFELSNSGIATLNESFNEKLGFVPVSGFVTGSVDPARTIFMVGTQRRRELDNANRVRERIYFAHCMLGAAGDPFIVVPTLPGILNSTQHGGVSQHANEMSFPGMNYKPSNIQLPLYMWQVVRWNGRELTFGTLPMGPTFPHRPIFGAHAGPDESWIVGEGFALKGPNP